MVVVEVEQVHLAEVVDEPGLVEEVEAGVPAVPRGVVVVTVDGEHLWWWW